MDYANIANISVAMSLIVALIVGTIQVRAAARDRRERLTLEALSAFSTRDFAAKITFIRSQEFPDSMASLEKMPMENQIDLIHFAQQMESLGMMLDEGIVDVDLVERCLGVFVIDAWKRYEPLIRSGRARDTYLGEYFEAMALQLEERMRLLPRVPAYQRLKRQAA